MRDGCDDAGFVASKTPKRCGIRALLVLLLSSCCCAILYVPFIFALLWQSMLDKCPVDPKDWKNAITWRSFGIGFLGFFSWVALIIMFSFQLCPLFPLLIWLSLHQLSIVVYVWSRPELTYLTDKNIFLCTRKIQNIPSILGVAAEYIQLSAVSALPYTSQFPERYAHGIDDAGDAAIFSSLSTSQTSWSANTTEYVILLACVCTTVLYLIIIGYWICTERSETPGFVFGFLPGVCYMTLATRILTAAANDASLERLTAWMRITLLLPWLLYVASAPFLAAYRAPGIKQLSEIIYIPAFECLERWLKGVLCSLLPYVSKSSWACGITVLAIEIALLVVLWILQPCSSPSLTTIRKHSLLICIWYCVCSLCVARVTPRRDLESAKPIWLTLVSCGLFVGCTSGLVQSLRQRTRIEGEMELSDATSLAHCKNVVDSPLPPQPSHL